MENIWIESMKSIKETSQMKWIKHPLTLIDRKEFSHSWLVYKTKSRKVENAEKWRETREYMWRESEEQIERWFSKLAKTPYLYQSKDDSRS